MIAFVLCAALLVAVVLALLLPPLWRAPRPACGADARTANLAIFRDQIRELERERNEGSLAVADFAQAQEDLQRRLLDEVQTPAAKSSATVGARRSAWALLILLPLAAAGGYAWLGNSAALDAQQRAGRIAPQQIAEMVARLAEKLRKSPDDAQGWLMLARSYKVLERFAEAADAYEHARTLVDQDPALLADYAEVLSRVNRGSLQGKPSELLTQALSLDPDASQALLMAGAAAAERNDFAAAAEHWQRLLAQLDADSEEGRTVSAAVDKARQMVAQNRDRTTGRSGAAAKAGFVSGEVTLSGKLAGQAKPDDVLFVFARAETGQRMPLAAVRATVADLPLRFRFDDAMSLAGGGRISDFRTIAIEARITQAGQAQTSSGDLFGVLGGVKPGSRGLRVLIDRVQH